MAQTCALIPSVEELSGIGVYDDSELVEIDARRPAPEPKRDADYDALIDQLSIKNFVKICQFQLWSDPFGGSLCLGSFCFEG